MIITGDREVRDSGTNFVTAEGVSIEMEQGDFTRFKVVCFLIKYCD